jgi:DinB family
MMDVADIQELYRYNQWANDRVFEAVSGLVLTEFTRDLGNSYPSVRDTLTHIVRAEWMWLQRWKGTSPQHKFDATEFSHVKVLNTRWSELKAEQSRRRGCHRRTSRWRRDVRELAGSNVAIRPLAPDVPRCEPFDVSPRSAHDDAATVGDRAGSHGLSGVPR